MKKIIIVLLLLPCLLNAQQFEEAISQKWLRVYQFELDDLPKSALQLVDSIYHLARKAGDNKQRIKW